MADGLKDRNLQDYYESMLEMFSTKGWKYFSEDIDRLLTVANTLEGLNRGDTVDFRLGQKQILDIIKAQPAVIRAAYDAALEGSEDA